jgi:hypothetical protein
MKRVVAIVAAFLISVAPVAHTLSHGGDDHGTCVTCVAVRSPLSGTSKLVLHRYSVPLGVAVVEMAPSAQSALIEYSRPRGPPL